MVFGFFNGYLDINNNVLLFWVVFSIGVFLFLGRNWFGRICLLDDWLVIFFELFNGGEIDKINFFFLFLKCYIVLESFRY